MDLNNEILATREEIKNLGIDKKKLFELIMATTDSQVKSFLMDEMKALNDQMKALNDQMTIEKEKGINSSFIYFNWS